ncbi:hypothetical protein [Enterococcus alishanensis]
MELAKTESYTDEIGELFSVRSKVLAGYTFNRSIVNRDSRTQPYYVGRHTEES